MTVTNTASQGGRQAVWVIILCGCVVSALAFGPRAIMGLFLDPMVGARGWSITQFALAIAVQNLVWGAAQPFAGAAADRYGAFPVFIFGGLIYALGLASMAIATDVWMLQVAAGLFVGLGVACSAFGLVLTAFTRLIPADNRSVAFGLGTAAGSFGQFLFAPAGGALIAALGWQGALYVLAAVMLAIPFLASALRGGQIEEAATAAPTASRLPPGRALALAFGHRSYVLLTLGFFVCGFHVAFITVYLPPYVNELGLPGVTLPGGLTVALGAFAIALIGLFNVVGAYSSGLLSRSRPKQGILSAIYFARAAAITLFVLSPPSTLGVLVFSAVMGVLWLSTIPPTAGLVAAMFGPRNMGLLYGVVFFSHQIGSFIGIAMGGAIYEATASYDGMWWAGVAMGIVAGIIHLPIRDRAVAVPAPA